MYLSNLKLNNFKTYTECDVDFCPNVNCLVGNNGVGKTNLLDAIYYLSFCKSYFNSIDTMNIRVGEEYFAIHGRYFGLDDTGEERLVSCVQKRGHPKMMKYEKKAYKSFSDHIGKIPLVIVSPTDQGMILGGSDVRRKFMDGVISQTDKDYLRHLLQYTKAVEQRNHLLKQMNEAREWDEEAIEMWDMQLVQHGEKLFESRVSFLEKFEPLFLKYYGDIATGKETPSLIYNSQMLGETPFEEQLRNAHAADRVVQYTTIGPHKDDLHFKIENMAIKKFGSQGQQKTFSLALKLAQFQYINDALEVKPILLLDDIFDKLDLPRITQLIQLVGSERFGQVFITDTQPGRVEQIFREIPTMEHKLFTVEDGQIKEKE